jgi:hypothetical protein
MFSEAGWRQKPFHWFSIFAATHFNSRVLRKSEFRSTIFGVFGFVVFTTTPLPPEIALEKVPRKPVFFANRASPHFHLQNGSTAVLLGICRVKPK